MEELLALKELNELATMCDRNEILAKAFQLIQGESI